MDTTSHTVAPSATQHCPQTSTRRLVHAGITHLCIAAAFAYALALTPLAYAQAPASAPTPAPAAAATPTPAGAPAAAAPKPAQPASTVVTIGKEKKQTVGKLVDLDRGDNGCFVTFKDDRGGEHIELGKFEMCNITPSPKGKKIEVTYQMETVQAASCYGDKKCTKTETLPVITAIKALE
jgi:hypothetical protein